MLKKVVVSVEEFVALGIGTFERLFMRMDGANMTLQMLSTMETLSTPLDNANIRSSVPSWCNWRFLCLWAGLDRDSAATTFLCEIGHRDGQCRARPGSATLRRYG